jgi:hypothetical protein
MIGRSQQALAASPDKEIKMAKRTDRYPVSYDANAQRMTENRYININRATRQKLERIGAELCETPSGSVKILKRNGKWATKKGQGSLAKVITGRRHARRVKGAGPNDYRLEDFGIVNESTKSARVVKPTRVSKEITINGMTGTPEDLRKFFGV